MLNAVIPNSGLLRESYHVSGSAFCCWSHSLETTEFETCGTILFVRRTVATKIVGN